jgi:hypothetical protein
MNAKAAKKAGRVQAAAADRSALLQQRQFEQTRTDLAPWRTVGASALNQMAGILGLEQYAGPPQPAAGAPVGYFGAAGASGRFGPSGGFLPAGIDQNQPVSLPENAPPGAQDRFAPFFQSPDYQFRLSEGLKAINRGQAARGLLGSGQTLKAVTEYGQNIAAGAYNDYMNRLANLAGIGQASAAQTGALGAQSAAQQGNAIQAGAQARASGYIGSANAIGSTLGDIAGFAGWAGGQYGLFNKNPVSTPQTPVNSSGYRGKYGGWNI